MHHQRCTTRKVVAMRSWKVSPLHISILELLSEGVPIRKIARSVGLDHSTIVRHVKQLEKRGYVSRQVRSSQVLYSILPLGMELMHHPVRNQGQISLTGSPKDAPPREKIPDRIRLHRLQIKFDLVNSVPDPTVIQFKDYPSEVVHMGPKKNPTWSKNIIQFEDFTAILSTKSLIISGVQRYLEISSDVQVQEADIMAQIVPFAEQLEARIQRSFKFFKLKRLDRGMLSGKIISHELAFEHHPIAEKVKHMRIDNEEGNPRIIVDQSKGFPELETVDKKTATEDMEMLRRNTLTLATSDLSIALQALNQQISVSTELAKHATTAQDQMDQVIASLGKITQAIGVIIGGK